MCFLRGCSSRAQTPARRFVAGNYAMLGRMIRGLPLLFILVSMSVSSAESVQIITAEDWARPRTGESLVRMPALKRTVRDYLDQKRKSSQKDQTGQRITIRHPRGEEGVFVTTMSPPASMILDS